MKATEVVKVIRDTNNWAILSAEKSHLDELTKVLRHRATLELLNSIGYQPVEGFGAYEGTRERSIFVPSIDFATAVALGRVLCQESVLLPNGLVYVDGSKVIPMLGAPKFLKADSDEPEAYTEIDGRRFVCPLRW